MRPLTLLTPQAGSLRLPRRGSGNDQTYQYASSGAALGNNALTSGDTAPRGVATNAAGTKEWVVDANKNVYVYSPGGTLLGSWSAGGLSSSAMLTGIATNGTDIWLVDNYADKVYKYAGAASRLSGSQNAGQQFQPRQRPVRATHNPQDIVTDGTSFWVVDGTALKVFKYTLSGSLLGSWAIDPANAHPTGITINPTNVSDIWIVDSGTLKVYQYTAAASRTSGSQNARRDLRPGRRRHQPAGHRRPAAGGHAGALQRPGRRPSWHSPPRWFRRWPLGTRCSPCWPGSLSRDRASPRSTQIQLAARTPC